jgi:starvation-inducible DNA-binding protein
MYETRNALAHTTRRSVIEMLNEHLADAIDLQLQAKQAHWNIKGPNFVGLHELFDLRRASTRT